MMIVVAACVCVGIGCLLSHSSQKKKLDAILLERATHVPELKGLGRFSKLMFLLLFGLISNFSDECLEKAWRNSDIVVVHGTVGSTSTVEKSPSSVFVEETALLKFKRINQFGQAIPDVKRTLLSRKEVPWYLDDDTARVYVTNYRCAQGFYDILKKYVSTEPVTKYFESLVNDKTVKIPDVKGSKCRQLLEIGTHLTVYGRAVKDEDGAIKIVKVSQFFSGIIKPQVLITDLNSNSDKCGNLSILLTAMGLVFLAVSVLQSDVEVNE